MKARLPKNLLAALMAATAMIATTNAATTKAEIKTYGTHAPVEIINVAAGESAALESDDVTEKTAQYLTIAKDGEGAVTVTGDIVKYHALMVREGKLEIGEGSSLTINIGYDANKNYRTAFSVAGKDSEVVLNNATLNLASSEPHLNVGGGSGNGTLTLDNGSYANLAQSHLVTIGVEYWVDGTYESASSNTPYRGNYITSAHDGKSLQGKGVLNIRNGSVVSVGSVHSKDYGSFWMGEGELNVIGEGSKLVLFEQEGYRTITNMDVGSTSVINVKDGGYAWLNTSVVQMNYSNESLVVINVDGKNSELVIGNSNHVEYGDVTKIAAFNEENTSAVISVTNGGRLAFESTNTIMSGAVIPGKVSYTVDAASSGSFNGLTIYNGVAINNAGTMDASSLYMSGGSVANTGVLSVDSAFCVYAGSVSNSGSIVVDYFEVSGEGSCFSFDSNSSLTADCTWITESASVNYTYFGETSETGAPITIIAIEDGYNAFDMDEGTNFNLELSGEYLSSLEGTEASLLVKVASGNLDNCNLNNTFTVSFDNSVIWSADGLAHCTV